MTRDWSISVVIPTYNDGEHLGRAIASVFDQELLPNEVIVVDDGSDPPGPASFVESFLGGPTDVRLVQKPNGGPSSARNAGLDLTRTTHVAFLDADDSWQRDFLSSKVRLAEGAAHPGGSYVGVYGTFVDVTTGRRTRFRNADGPIDPDWIGRPGGVPGGVPMYLFRREPLIALGGFDEDLVVNEDFDLIARLVKAGHPLLGCAGATYRRNIRPTSWSRSSVTRSYLGTERFLDKAAALELLSKQEIARRRKSNTLVLAKEFGLRGKSPRMALTLCRRAFSHAPPARPAEVPLWLASRVLPTFLEREVVLPV